MIPEAPPAPDWQESLRQAYRDPAALLADLELSDALPQALLPRKGEFAMRVPRGFAARMRPGDPDDPLLRQVLPLQAERTAVAGFVADPLAESGAQPSPGLIHKYRGRALLITTGACAVHCRYCFRREFPYAESAAQGAELSAALSTLAADRSIHEVILSGGDPLNLSDARLTRLLQQLEAIPQLRRLRIHSRQPVVLPERLTAGLISLLATSRLRVVLVIHANHGNELDASVAAALQPLRQAGITLLNQSVLLAGVNDSAAALAALSERLFELGVLPYYLHQLDPVRGAAHFALADRRARGIMRELNGLLPGYLVPRLVREIPGQSGKTPISW